MSEIDPPPPFPASIKTVSDTIAAGINNEAKALAFSHITEEFRTVSQISKAGNAAQDNPPIWAYTPQRIKDYSASFLGVEAITKDYIGGNNELALRLTELGSRLARPLGGHLLLLSSEINPALFEIFGATQTTSKKGVRSVENRLKIMRTLLEVRIIGITDIGNEQGIGPRAVGDNTDQMHKAGLINKKDSRAGLPYTLWVASTHGGQIESSEHIYQLRRDVIEVINAFASQNPERPFSSIDIARTLPLSYGFADNPGEVVNMVAATLGNMSSTTNPSIRKHSPTEDKNRQIISIKPEQAALFSKILHIIDAAVEEKDDFIEEGRLALQEVLGDTQIVRRLIGKGYEHSQAKKKEQAGMLDGLVLDIIAESAEPISRRQIVNSLAGHGVNVHFETVSRYIKKHLETGKIENRPHESGLGRYVVSDQELRRNTDTPT